MPSLKALFITVSSLLLQINAQVKDEWASPCPRLFVYENTKEPGKWYGIITLISDVDLQGVWLRVVFDKTPQQLGNWFGQVNQKENNEYLIKNPEHQLKAHVPTSVRFFTKYDQNETPPKLISFRLNARTVCPEGAGADSIPLPPKLQTSDDNNTQTIYITPKPMALQGSVSTPANNGGDSTLTGPCDKDEGEFPKSFCHFLWIDQQSHTKNNAASNSICGTVVVQPTPLIKGGLPTEAGEFPWHAALYHTKGIDLAYICGASLISKYHVITVGHCVTKSKSRTPLNPSNLVVYLGKYNLREFSSPGIQNSQVSQIILHPEYNPQYYSNDIAIIKFRDPVEYTDYVRPICLWQDSRDLSTIIDKLGKVVGWSFEDNGLSTESLMQAQMPVVSYETCLRSYPDFYSHFTLGNTSYCAGFKNGTESAVCNGDSGGGMVFPKSGSTRNPVWQLRGLVSISVALPNQFKCDPSHYAVFTDAAMYLDWIMKTIMQ